MLKTSLAAAQASNFSLKNELVELVPSGRTAERAVMSIAELEAMRTQRTAVSASKHGLELICGASCETGAQ